MTWTRLASPRGATAAIWTAYQIFCYARRGPEGAAGEDVSGLYNPATMGWRDKSVASVVTAGSVLAPDVHEGGHVGEPDGEADGESDGKLDGWGMRVEHRNGGCVMTRGWALTASVNLARAS